MIKRMLRSLLCATLALVPFAVLANDAYPNRPITLVAPFPPGGSTDVIARLFANKLGARLGQSVIVENKPGANGAIGAAAVARAPHDGYTLLIMGASSFTINPLVYDNLNYDPLASYEYVGIAGGTQLVVLANPATGLRSIADIVKRSGGDPLSYGSFGTASLPQIAGEYLALKTGARLLHVPYRGSSPAMTDLIGGQIPLSIDTLVASLPQIHAGKVRAIAVTSRKRVDTLPDVPTVMESGVPDYDFETWFGLVAPKGTPANAIAHLGKEVQAMMADPDTQRTMAATGFDSRFLSAADFRALVTRELQRNKEVIAAAHIKAN